jgi:hypothetical protein
MTQLTKSALVAKYATLFANNSTGEISAADLREMVQDVSDSFPALLDDAGVAAKKISATISFSDFTAISSTSAKALFPNTMPSNAVAIAVKMSIVTKFSGVAVTGLNAVLFKEEPPTSSYPIASMAVDVEPDIYTYSLNTEPVGFKSGETTELWVNLLATSGNVADIDQGEIKITAIYYELA